MRGWVPALCACALAGCLLALPAAAAAPDAETQASLDRSVRFLQEAQNMDGGFGGRRGGASDPDFSAWAAYALAAASINPQDQAQPGGIDVFSYLTAHTSELRETTDFDRVALVALASGTSPYSFGAVDPIETMLSRRLPDGSFAQQAGGKSGWINATIWSIFPLSALETPAADSVVREAAQWLLGQQRPDGSWGSTTAASLPDSDMTGAAIQALNDAGMRDTEAERRAFEFLKEARQGPDGGFRETEGSPTNSATTAWVVQGMWAAGIDPREWRTESGADPLGYLASLQRPDGSIGWTATDDLNSLWMTAQVGPALAGTTYPLPSVPRAQAPPTRPAPAQPPGVSQPPPSSHSGHGGTGLVHGDGVIAGGGGRGAPIFSGPQPQSGGSTPHGAREPDAAARPEPTPDRSLPPPGATTSAASGPGGSGARSSGSDGNGSERPGSVEGVLVSGGAAAKAPAAPGLFGADSGGESDRTPLVAVLAALALAAILGSRRERPAASLA